MGAGGPRLALLAFLGVRGVQGLVNVQSLAAFPTGADHARQTHRNAYLVALSLTGLTPTPILVCEGYGPSERAGPSAPKGQKELLR